MKEKKINLLGIRPSIILCRIEPIKGKPSGVYMEPITEEQEVRIDKAAKYYGEIRYERPDGIIINAKNIYLYGEVNFEDNNDLYQIEKFNLIDNDGNYIYSKFDYDKGCFTTIDGHAKTYPTWSPITWFKYCHCLIGKPQRIIVYRNPIIKRK